MTCPRCDDTGLVAGEKVVNDVRYPDGTAKVVEAYRCSCPAGDTVSKHLRPEPSPPVGLWDGRRWRIPAPRHPKV